MVRNLVVIRKVAHLRHLVLTLNRQLPEPCISAQSLALGVRLYGRPNFVCAVTHIRVGRRHKGSTRAERSLGFPYHRRKRQAIILDVKGVVQTKRE